MIDLVTQIERDRHFCVCGAATEVCYSSQRHYCSGCGRDITWTQLTPRRSTLLQVFLDHQTRYQAPFLVAERLRHEATRDKFFDVWFDSRLWVEFDPQRIESKWASEYIAWWAKQIDEVLRLPPEVIPNQRPQLVCRADEALYDPNIRGLSKHPEVVEYLRQFAMPSRVCVNCGGTLSGSRSIRCGNCGLSGKRFHLLNNRWCFYLDMQFWDELRKLT